LISGAAATVSAQNTVRRSRNQKNRNISRKDAKAAKKKKKYLSELGVLRALAGGISESEMSHVSDHLRKPRKFSRLVVQKGGGAMPSLFYFRAKSRTRESA
jgi:hypothetical protein